MKLIQLINAIELKTLLLSSAVIDVELKDNCIDFRIENTIKKHVPKESKKQGGLGNIRKRLALLYKDQYQLETKIENNRYKVYLSVPESIA